MASWHRTGADYRFGRDHRDALSAETWSGLREAVEVALNMVGVVVCFTVTGELVSG